MRDVRVLFFGDSFVAGVGDPTGLGWVGRCVAAAYAAGGPVTAYNLGVRRDTSRDVLARWEGETRSRLAPPAPTRVVFSFGANDAVIEDGAPRVPAAETVRHLEVALARAAALGLPALVVGPPPVADADPAPFLALAAVLRTATHAAAVPFVDVTASLAGSAVWRAECARGDGAHPAAGGYGALAALVEPAWLDWR